MRLATAQRLLAEVQDIAAASSLRLSAVVVDRSGFEVASARMDGATWFTLGAARSKARTAAALGRPSAALGVMKHEHPDLWLLVGEQLPFTPTVLPGGILIQESGAVLGAVGVSGAAPEDDVRVAERAVHLLASENRAAAPDVPAGGTNP